MISQLPRMLVFLTVFILAGCRQPHGAEGERGHAKGVREGLAAIAAGKLKLKEYPPLPSPAQHGEYIKLLHEKCGVEYEVVSSPGPGLSDELIKEVQGWNSAMEEEIRRKFGSAIFEELHREADKRWEDKRK